MQVIQTHPLTSENFAPFGEVLEAVDNPDKIINQGLCGRWHDQARLDFSPDGRAGISIFKAQPRSMPYQFDMVERHPDGSQAFIPMGEDPFLVIAALDKNGLPQTPMAFVTNGTQGINFRKGVWHGVLTPLHPPGLFAVVDRIGPTRNLEEYWFDIPWAIQA